MHSLHFRIEDAYLLVKLYKVMHPESKYEHDESLTNIEYIEVSFYFLIVLQIYYFNI